MQYPFLLSLGPIMPLPMLINRKRMNCLGCSSVVRRLVEIIKKEEQMKGPGHQGVYCGYFIGNGFSMSST